MRTKAFKVANASSGEKAIITEKQKFNLLFFLVGFAGFSETFAPYMAWIINQASPLPYCNTLYSTVLECLISDPGPKRVELYPTDPR